MFSFSSRRRTPLSWFSLYVYLWAISTLFVGCPQSPSTQEPSSTQESTAEKAKEPTLEHPQEPIQTEPFAKEEDIWDASAEQSPERSPEKGPEPRPEPSPAEEAPPEQPAQEAAPPESTCGNKLCDPGETTTSCPQDCPPTIWKPTPGTTWHWQLTGTLDTSVKAQMYDIDLFDHTAQTIASLKAQQKVVICYFSAGSYEDWRPDKSAFTAAVKGQKMDGWDELWLDIRATNVRDIMKTRLDLAKQKGCDGVEPDNVDGYQNKTGFPLTAQDQLDFNRFLASEAHKRGLSIGLKNDLDQIKQLVGDFDWALNEECLSYNECSMLQPFLDAGKAVFHVEYDKTKSQVCPKVPQGFSSMIKHWDLDAWAITCW
ncbi:MAG: endo alpha-1,4 polygalactosaminidase [Myxococcales bacterium]|nr:endo alpha-1,4 polygalactosaminidase [Myxococcales bacterium]